MKTRNTKKIIFYVLAVILIVMLAFSIFRPFGEEAYGSVGELINDVKAGLDSTEPVIKEFSINESGKCTVKLVKNGKDVTKTYNFTSLGYNYFEKAGCLEALEQQRLDGKITSLDFTPPSRATMLMQYIPYILLFGLIIFTVIAFMRTSGKGGALGNFGKARTKIGSDEKKKVLFRDVAGADDG